MLKRVFLIGAVAIVSIFVIACGDDNDEETPDEGGEATTAEAATDDGGGEAQTVDVVATDLAFDVSDISAAPGDEITINFTNAGEAPHTFTIDAPEFEVEAAAGGGADSGTFTSPDASTEFYCRYHPTQMRGTITIDRAAAQIQQDDNSGSSTGYNY